VGVGGIDSLALFPPLSIYFLSISPQAVAPRAGTGDADRVNDFLLIFYINRTKIVRLKCRFFDQNLNPIFDFWSEVQFLAKALIIGQKFDVWSKLRFFCQNFDF